MTSDPHGATWWHERNAQLRDSPWADGESLLPEHVCALLDSVEAAFAITGADTPGWAGRPLDQPPAEEEYSRCLDPSKFTIVRARIDAWVTVLAQREWAQVTTEQSTALPGDSERSRTRIVLSPTERARTAGAVPMTVLADESTAPGEIPIVEISVGDRPFTLARLPDCGCDACDSGSAWLLEELDQWMLSVVDGSLIVDPSAQLQVRTAFGGHGSSGGSAHDSGPTTAFTAAPWAARWTPLPVPDHGETQLPVDPGFGRRAAIREWVRDLNRRLRGQPRPDRGWTIYSPGDHGQGGAG